MARTNAMNIVKEDGSTPALLAELYNGVLDNVAKRALFAQMRNTNLSGDPRSGSVVVRRFANGQVDNYSDTDDNKLEALEVTVNVNTAKKIRERFVDWDIAQYGIENLISQRTQNYETSMISFMDSVFFAEAEASGTQVTLTGDTDADKLEQLIQSVETVSNDYVNGVDRALITVTLKPAVYGRLRNYIDSQPNPVDGGLRIDTFHGVRVFSNHRQTVDAIVMVNGAIAMPISIVGAKVDQIPGTVESYAGLYFKYGVKTVMPDLVKYASFEEVSA